MNEGSTRSSYDHMDGASRCESARERRATRTSNACRSNGARCAVGCKRNNSGETINPVIAILEVPADPAFTVTLEGLAVIVKS